MLLRLAGEGNRVFDKHCGLRLAIHKKGFVIGNDGKAFSCPFWITSIHWQLYLFAIAYGFAHGGFFTLISPLIADLFGTRARGTLFGFSSFISTIGGAAGPLIAGRIFDVSGSYSLVFWLVIGFSVVGLLLSLFLKPIEKTGTIQV